MRHLESGINIASVRNSDELGMEPGPEHPSINDSMSSIIKFEKKKNEDLLTINRTIK